MRQQQRGSTRLAADCGGWLSYAAVTPAWFIVERWRKRQLWFAAMTAKATCMCCATSCCRPSGAVWLVDEDLGNRASLFIFLTAIQYTDPWHGVLRRMWRGPRVRCLLHGDEREEEVQWRVWRGPRALCHRSGDGETACERSGFDGFTLSDDVCWGSGTTAIGAA